jgi:tetratricopeptide (TPR) repeat protein
MSQTTPSASAASSYEQLCSAEQATRFTAAQIREAIAHWVSQDRMDHAEALVAAGLGLYPESQDILAIGALLAEIQEDWAQAQLCIERLMLVQGEDSPPDTWRHLVRVMRCRQAYHQAFMHAQKALQRFPDHTELREEHAQLAALMEPAVVQTKAEALVV